MNDLKRLYEENKFNEILELESQIKEPQDLFLLISSCLSLGDGKKAMEILLAHRDALWDHNPVLTMKADLETRAILGQFDEAYKDMDYFQNKPYVSQEVEEALRHYPKWLRQKEFEGYSKKPTDASFRDRYEDAKGNDLKLLEALLTLRKIEDIRDAAPILKEILLSPHHDDIVNTVLMLLIAIKCPEEIRFEKGGKSYALIPAKTLFPYAGQFYGKTRDAISETKDSPSIQETAATLLDNYLMIAFPDSPLKEGNIQAYANASLGLARTYYGLDIGELTEEEKYLKEEMSLALSLHPPLMSSF